MKFNFNLISPGLTLVTFVFGLWSDPVLAFPKRVRPYFSTSDSIPSSNYTGTNCEPLSLSACRTLGLYSHVQLPNALGHATQHEISRAFTKFSPMLRTAGCGEWFSVLLCLTFAPPCPSNEQDIPSAPACRGLCASAWAGCWPLLDKAGMKWPRSLDCETLPIGLEEDGKECVMRKGSLVNHTGLENETRSLKVSPTPLKVKTESSRSKTVKKNALSPPTKPQKQTFKVPVAVEKPLKKKTVTKFKNSTQVKSTVIGRRHDSTRKTVKRSSKVPSALKPRRYDIRERGDPELFHGWVDIQGQGAANDYCRVIGTGVKQRFLSCVLAGGNGQDHVYVSKQGFEIGHQRSWFMRDMDKDGRDDYCRCVGHGLSSKIACMKAGKFGFHGSPLQPGNQFTFYVKSRVSCLGKKSNPALGPAIIL